MTAEGRRPARGRLLLPAAAGATAVAGLFRLSAATAGELLAGAVLSFAAALVCLYLAWRAGASLAGFTGAVLTILNVVWTIRTVILPR